MRTYDNKAGRNQTGIFAVRAFQFSGLTPSQSFIMDKTIAVRAIQHMGKPVCTNITTPLLLVYSVLPGVPLGGNKKLFFKQLFETVTANNAFFIRIVGRIPFIRFRQDSRFIPEIDHCANAV